MIFTLSRRLDLVSAGLGGCRGGLKGIFFPPLVAKMHVTPMILFVDGRRRRNECYVMI